MAERTRTTGRPRRRLCADGQTAYHGSIGYCGKAANAAAYAASPAPSLEAEFAATCPDHKAYDCGPGRATCTNGKCTVQGFACCHCPPPDASPDLPLSTWDAAKEAGGGEIGGGEAGGSETGGVEAGGGEAGGQ